MKHHEETSHPYIRLYKCKALETRHDKGKLNSVPLANELCFYVLFILAF